MSATASTPESSVEEQPVHPDSFDTGAGLDEAAEPPAQEPEGSPSPAETPDPAKGGAPAAPAPAQAAPPQTPEPDEKVKAVQAWATKVSQENAELRKQLAAGKPPSQPIEAAPAPRDDYDWATFNKLAEEKGREAAFAHRDQWLEERLMRKVEERETARSRQSRIEAETTRLFQAHHVQDADIEVMRALSQQETEQGFIPSPGALLALRLGGGSWEETVRLIEAGRAAAAAPAAPPAPTRHPGAPGGAAPRSPVETSRKTLQVPARSIGL